MSEELDTKTKARAYALKTKYGITIEQYDQMRADQNYSCPVCLRHEDTFPTRLAVDHNHKTLEVRGLLCQYCNHRIIGRHTDAELVQRMADYLKKGTGLFAPPPKKRAKRRRKAKP